MRAIVGYGNELRGEDAFGIDVIKKLEKQNPKETKLISAFGLTPEIALELLDADEVIFIDAAYDEQNCYALACTTQTESSNLSHHILPQTIISILNDLYDRHPSYLIYSMLTNSFDEIKEMARYNAGIQKILNELL